MKTNKQSTKNYKLVFMGTSEFALPILKKILSTDYCLLTTVITQPDKKTGRKKILTPPPVKVIAQKYKIPVYQPEKLSVISYQLSVIKPDIIIVTSYGQIIPKQILEIPKYGCINIHPSLLPKHRGPSPIVSAILKGDEETGITIIKMNEKMDAGDIIAQKKIKINSDETTESLSKKMSDISAEFLIDILPQYISEKAKPKTQEEKKATYTKIIKKIDGHINWQKPASEIEREIRAYYIWPGSFTYWRYKIRDMRYEKMIKILEVKISTFKSSIFKNRASAEDGQNSKLSAGTVFLTPKKELAIACGKGYLIIKKLQLEGKKAMPACEFLKGHSKIIGTILKC